MRQRRIKSVKYTALTIGAGISFLLWATITILTIRSYWYTDTLYFPQYQEQHELSCYRGRFLLTSWHDPRNDESNHLPCELSTTPTSFYHDRIEPMMQKIMVNQKQLLGFGWGRGDSSQTIHDAAWIRWFLYIPAWFLLVILAVLPVGWFRRRKSYTHEDRRITRRYLFFGSSILLTILIVLGALLAINTTFFGSGETPLSGQTSHQAAIPKSDNRTIKLTVMTYNIWMGGAYRGFWRFEKPERVAERIRNIGELIKKHDTDLVFLQEVVMESGPGSVDQTPLIAAAAGMHMWVFGEAINQGLPFYRMIEGNAILSRWPLAIVANQPMAGRSPFYRIGADNQRTLWCKTYLGEQEVLLGCVHLTKSKHKFKPTQMQQILDFVGGQPAILAGDFNAGSTSDVIQQIIDTDRFRAQFSVIDHIFVPKRWELIEQKVIESDLSDHLPVIATFRIPVTDNLDSTD